jgi:hypothetical protein
LTKFARKLEPAVLDPVRRNERVDREDRADLWVIVEVKSETTIETRGVAVSVLMRVISAVLICRARCFRDLSHPPHYLRAQSTL